MMALATSSFGFTTRKQQASTRRGRADAVGFVYPIASLVGAARLSFARSVRHIAFTY
jgi:hypothetical protein